MPLSLFVFVLLKTIANSRYSDALQGGHMNKLLNSISSAFMAEFEATACDIEQEDQPTFTAHHCPPEKYMFCHHCRKGQVLRGCRGCDAPVAPVKS
jgi:hypothetical protein